MIKDLKIEILLFYYDRPKMASNFAIASVFESHYTNWELTLIDDSSNQDGEKIVKEFKEKNPHYNERGKVKVIATGDSLEEKEKRGGSLFGSFANTAIEKHSNADICLMLCDDDALHKNYLKELNSYYLENSEVIYSYCRVAIYNPLDHENIFELQKIHLLDEPSEHPLNASGSIPNACCLVDASQVSWRRDSFLKDKIFFDFPLTSNLDADLYQKMSDKWGDCKENKILGQYKAVFTDQLGSRDQIYKILET